MKVSVSILGLDDRKKAISLLNNTNCDYIHIDVMDGSFVPNKQFTTEEINNLGIISKKKFDVHLMVDNPRRYIENLDISNIEYIIVHSEIDKDINELLDLIKSYNVKCGLSIKPNTDISILTPYLNKLDLILVMSVEPGFSGQEFISNSLDKVSKLKQIIKNNNLDIDDALKKLKDLPYEDLGYAHIDHHRNLRNGFPEVIYCKGKSDEHILGIIERMNKKSTNILGTRCRKKTFDKISKIYPNAEYEEVSQILKIKNEEIKEQGKGKILIITGGTSDIPVADEAYYTAKFFGNEVERLYDVGVAGIHRLLSHRNIIEEARVIVAVAGMEGALASVVGGLVDVPVIAVPTSVGYGANFDGLAPLLAMLNSCASGISVVNIDNGFGAGYLASTINKLK